MGFCTVIKKKYQELAYYILSTTFVIWTLRLNVFKKRYVFYVFDIKPCEWLIYGKCVVYKIVEDSKVFFLIWSKWVQCSLQRWSWLRTHIHIVMQFERFFQFRVLLLTIRTTISIFFLYYSICDKGKQFFVFFHQVKQGDFKQSNTIN